MRLDHRGAKVLVDTPARAILDLFIGPEGRVHVLDARSLRELQGDALVEVEGLSLEGVAPVDHVALAKDGAVWVVAGGGVGTRVEGEWEMTPLAELGLEGDAEHGAEVEVAIDSEGVVWVVGPRAAFYRAQGQWRPLDLSIIGATPRLLHPTPSALGRVHTTNGAKLSRLHPTQLENVLIETKGSRSYATDLAVSADGYAGLVTRTCDLVRVTPKPPTKIWRLAGTQYACETAEAIAIDARHRFWVASREGLSVVGEDRRVREYPAGSLPALDGRVSEMVVVGQGPALPSVAK
ncbi:hypothetical protein [Enhygromyxa salina]|uniref:hypothetical protein n=1 Tax=Enhygromyxa salina TaxID=215803 RepID=UPI0015E5AC9E|nr:hypothetical protein [Enhygromyxa salina]